MLKNIIKEVIDEMSTSAEAEGYTSKWQKVNKKELRKNSKAFEYKDLWEETDPKLKKFIKNRIDSFNEIENKLNELVPLLRKAKQETIDFYKNKPSFNILYSNDLAVDYLDDMIKMFK